ncbi:glycine-rich cell wall structural protein-like [Homalodisca vitripennis]|uniref:glycine-rich cell wall structural protein-like n=1 Tax=Homalodisca vitripennis TaxID=197043 RepID=UPI001EECC8ED|nr:glycine-rich cell wall structural protein-like [Homalodisca vitripennis]
MTHLALTVGRVPGPYIPDTLRTPDVVNMALRFALIALLLVAVICMVYADLETAESKYGGGGRGHGGGHYGHGGGGHYGHGGGGHYGRGGGGHYGHGGGGGHYGGGGKHHG